MVYNKDLTNQHISESYQRVLQVSGSENVVLNGTGSFVDLQVNGIVTANSFVGNMSGSSGVNEDIECYARRVALLGIGV